MLAQALKKFPSGLSKRSQNPRLMVNAFSLEMMEKSEEELMNSGQWF